MHTKFSYIGVAFALLLSHNAQACNPQQVEQAEKVTDRAKKIALLKEALQVCGSSANIYAKYGRLLKLENRLPEAQQALQQAKNLLNPKQSDYNNELKKLLIELANIARQENDRVSLFGYLDEIKIEQNIVLDDDFWQLQQYFDNSINTVPLSGKELQRIQTKRAAGIDLSIDYNINFDFNDAKLTAEANQFVKEIVKGIADGLEAKNKIKIIGHTDMVGSEDYNYQLSLKRANAVKKAVIKLFPELSNRLLVEGKGKSSPKYPPTYQDADRLNRRVEFTIL